jgi:lipase maturation factor 1
MFSPESYTIALSLLPRLLGVIYFFAFGAFIFQIKGLIGSHGILPLTDYLNWIKRKVPERRFKLVPTLFWLNSSNHALQAVVYLGTFLSILLILGVYPSLILLLLYVLYLSIVHAGQDFLGFGWEGFLLEITVNTCLISLTSSPNIWLWISLNFVLFRFHIQAGAVKIQSEDVNWRNLKAIFYHYQSQPIPNLTAWYVYKLPMWVHKLSTAFMFIVELIIPFGMLGPDGMRLGVFIAFVGLQLAIWATGNFSYLNHLTSVLCVILLSNHYLSWFQAPAVEPTPVLVDTLLTGIGGFLFALQCVQFWQHFFPNHLFNSWLKVFSPYHIVNRYGIFAIMTTKRYEIVFEGSEDGKNWKEYYFYHKPGELNKRPTRISPYQPRLDWQAWFLPFQQPWNEPWLGSFIYHLLKGTPEVLRLIKYSPFATPPKYVRSLMYDYEFTTFEERKQTGNWWKRTYVDVFTLPKTLKE